MIKLPAFAAQFFPSLRTNPFGAVSQPASGIDFVADKVMQPVTADFHRDPTAWRVNHLPLVVGRVKPELLPKLSGRREAPDIQLDIDCLPPGLSFAACADQIGKAASIKSRAIREEIARDELLPLWAGLAQQIIVQDAKWFGAQRHSNVLLHREHIRPQDDQMGHGRYKFAGVWHRDAVSIADGNTTRVYAVRSNNPMHVLSNRLTEGVPNDGQGNVYGHGFERMAARANRRPQAGEIVLMNGGAGTGTVHASHVPQRGEGGPSCFFAVNCLSR